MKPGPIKTVMERMMGSKVSEWFGLNAGGKIDRWLLTRSNGRFALLVGWPIGLLETIGARSGQPRATAVMYLERADQLVLVASKGGAPEHPAWYHNVCANPDVRFRWKGRAERFVARVATDAERRALWPQILDLYPGYETYQGRTGGRVIPLVLLERTS